MLDTDARNPFFWIKLIFFTLIKKNNTNNNLPHSLREPIAENIRSAKGAIRGKFLASSRYSLIPSRTPNISLIKYESLGCHYTVSWKIEPVMQPTNMITSLTCELPSENWQTIRQQKQYDRHIDQWL